MAAWRATEDGFTLLRLVNDDGVDEADIVPRLRAEMERVDRYVIDMNERILPLWSSPHDFFPDVASVLQQWRATQPGMRAFFASPAYVEVRALRKKYVKLEQVADAVCELMDLKRWINGIDSIISVRAENHMVCMHKQRALQQLVTAIGGYFHEAGNDVQSSVDRLLNQTRATLELQQQRERMRLDRLAATDEDRSEIALIGRAWLSSKCTKSGGLSCVATATPCLCWWTFAKLCTGTTSCRPWSEMPRHREQSKACVWCADSTSGWLVRQRKP